MSDAGMNVHLVQFSTGLGSAEVARRVISEHGVANTHLLTADTRVEDEDNWRFAREAVDRANQQAPRTNTSGYKGVSWDKRKRRWAAYIYVDGRHRFLGYFDNPSAAAGAYNQAAIEAWGEFARLNVLRQSARPAGHARAVAVWRGVKA